MESIQKIQRMAIWKSSITLYHMVTWAGGGNAGGIWKLIMEYVCQHRWPHNLSKMYDIKWSSMTTYSHWWPTYRCMKIMEQLRYSVWKYLSVQSRPKVTTIASILHGMDTQHLWTLLEWWTIVVFGWLLLATSETIFSHRRSVGLKSGDCDDHSKWFTPFSYS